jgi:hypothetical protein
MVLLSIEIYLGCICALDWKSNPGGGGGGIFFGYVWQTAAAESGSILQGNKSCKLKAEPPKKSLWLLSPPPFVHFDLSELLSLAFLALKKKKKKTTSIVPWAIVPPGG